jgi:ribosomal protein L11 methyltransferase
MARLPVSNRPLWQISVTTSREAEDAVVALLESGFGQRAATYTPEDKDLSIVTVFLSGPRERVHSRREELEGVLARIADSGLNPGPCEVRVRRVPREDWSTSWKKYFKTIRIGKALLIKPSWSRDKCAKGQAVVTLDPGLSFGTGQHATTSFCLRQLVRTRRTGKVQSFLDIGTGSGILAIAAVKLGFRPVRAFDNDPTAVRVAKANARKNRVQSKLVIVRQDLTRMPKESTQRFDLICANLVHDLLLAECDRVLRQLRPGGRLVLAGLLRDQFSAVQAAYEAAGLKLQVVDTEGEWRSGAFISQVQ